MRKTTWARNYASLPALAAAAACALGRPHESMMERAAVSAPTEYSAAQQPPAEAQEGSSTEAYARIDENPFLSPKDDPLSTFSIDVDTASYANVRRFIESGSRPPKDAVRIEELLNYFDYDDQPPTDGAPFAVHAEVSTAPWAPKHRLVRIALAAKEIEAAKRPGSNLVFLIDVSGSMSDANKLPLLVQSMSMLVEQLDGRDKVGIVVYAGASGVVLAPTEGTDKEAILGALARLSAGGSTNGAAGIELAYQLAREGFVSGGSNRVILATDGDFNVGTTSEGDLTRLIEREAKSGVFLTVLGFGMGNYKDSTLEKLADRGNGNYAYIDTIREAKKVLVEQMTGTLVTVAKDVKIQVELNPTRVESYRLVGYENRLLRAKDFTDDTKDAGEIGAGHRVTALYEVVPIAGDSGPSTIPLRYQADRALTPEAQSSELLTVKLRYKEPDGATSREMGYVVADRAASIEQSSNDMRFAAAVAAFGMILRESPHRGQVSWEAVAGWARSAIGADRRELRRELVALVERASRL